MLLAQFAGAAASTKATDGGAGRLDLQAELMPRADRLRQQPEPGRRPAVMRSLKGDIG